MRPDHDELRRGVIGSATPVIALVGAVRAVLPPDVAAHVHRGATTQDVVDTAVVLALRDALSLLGAALADAASAAASLAARYRDTVLAGRTLLQQASPTTFGLKAAGWAVELHDAAGRIAAARDDRLSVQLGGAVGTLAVLGPDAARDRRRLRRRARCAPLAVAMAHPARSDHRRRSRGGHGRGPRARRWPST